MGKQFEVIKNTTRPDMDGITVDGRKMKFGRSGGFRIHDRSLANDIEQVHGRLGTGDVVVCETDDERPRREGYKYKFVVPALPWHKEDTE